MAFIVILALSFLAILLIQYIFNALKEDQKLPGPSLLRRIPYFGHSYLLGHNPIKRLLEFKEKYGGVFRLDIGMIPTVFLADWEAFSQGIKSGSLSGRPYKRIPTFSKLLRKEDSRGVINGVSFSEGKVWNEQRKFMHHTLNTLGVGKKDQMEVIIQEEAQALVDTMRKSSKEKQVDMEHYFMHAANSVIWRIATGKKCDPDDPDLKQLTSILVEFFNSLNPGSIFNMLQYYSPMFAKFINTVRNHSLISRTNDLFRILGKEIKQQEADEEGYFISRFLKKMELNNNNSQSSFYQKDGKIHLYGQVSEIFAAGTDTTSIMMEYMVLYMTEYPEIQEKIHQSIKEIYGLDDIISIRDTDRLPLVQALIEELSRHGHMAALVIPHEAEVDVTIKGQLIKKGTQVYFFSTGIHRDPKHFKDPEVFNPERFIDSEGKFSKDEHVNLFGYGKRKCVGEQLGKSEMFLFMSTLLQKFKFKKVHPDQKLSFEPVPGLAFHPERFHVVIEERV